MVTCFEGEYMEHPAAIGMLSVQSLSLGGLDKKHGLAT